MGARPNRCLFCDSTLLPSGSGGQARSDEHVFPLWLQRYLGITGAMVTPTRVLSANRSILDVRQHTMAAFVCGGICNACNTGWMSQLEYDVKPILVRLIDNPGQMETLTPGEQFKAARWVLKTACVLNRCSTYGTADDGIGRRVPDEHMRTVWEGGLPNDVLIVGAGHDSKRTLDFLQYSLWTGPANGSGLRQNDLDRSYKIGLSFRDLVLIVAYYPADYAYGINLSHYVPLWIGRRRVTPVDRLMDSPVKSTSAHLEGLMLNISVVSSMWLKLVENVASTRLVIG